MKFKDSETSVLHDFQGLPETSVLHDFQGLSENQGFP